MSADPNQPQNSFDVIADAFLSQPTPIVRCGFILALSINIASNELSSVVNEIWPETTLTETEVNSLSEWPFVLTGDSGWSMLPPVSAVLSLRLEQSDPLLFTRVHEHLADREASRTGVDELESWFIGGRTAYYLAGVDPAVSATRFGEAFEEAPVVDRTSCRIWLARLVNRQSHLLGENSRVVSFFKGFQHYIEGNYRMAAAQFDLVLAADDADMYRAIALHLRALSGRSRNADYVATMLSRSVELSAQLGLGVNEVMARNSLIWLFVRRQFSLEDILDLAELNVRRSRELEDKNLLGWCIRTNAVVRWLNYVGYSRDRVSEEARAALPELLGDLSEALALSEATDDPETVLFTLNDRASMFCDVGDIENAYIELETALEKATSLGIPSRVLTGLGKTSGRAAKIARGVGDRHHATQFWHLANGFSRLGEQFTLN